MKKVELIEILEKDYNQNKDFVKNLINNKKAQKKS